MRKEDELKVLLWQGVNGIRLLPSVIATAVSEVGEVTTKQFVDIYFDKEINVLLAMDFKVKSEYADFISKYGLNDIKAVPKIDFLLSREMAIIREIWKDKMLSGTFLLGDDNCSCRCQSLKQSLSEEGNEGQIRLEIGLLLGDLRSEERADVLYDAFTILALFTDNIAWVDVENVTALLAMKKEKLQKASKRYADESFKAKRVVYP